MEKKTARPVRRPLMTPPLHPGTLLREDVLPALRIKVTQAAAELGISRQLLHRILNADAPVTPEMAVRLGRWAGNGPHLWLTLQQQYDLWHAERDLAVELRAIPVRATPD